MLTHPSCNFIARRTSMQNVRPRPAGSILIRILFVTLPVLHCTAPYSVQHSNQFVCFDSIFAPRIHHLRRHQTADSWPGTQHSIHLVMVHSRHDSLFTLDYCIRKNSRKQCISCRCRTSVCACVDEARRTSAANSLNYFNPFEFY